MSVASPAAPDAKADVVRDATLAAIAGRAGFTTLKTRNADGLDFHDVAVWTMKRALEEAYAAGGAAARQGGALAALGDEAQA